MPAMIIGINVSGPETASDLATEVQCYNQEDVS